LIKEKLAAAKFAYEEELEFICAQFEEMQQEVKNLKNDKIVLYREKSHLENIITEQNNMIEVSGYKLLDNDRQN
jgi:hypothetical protein